MIWRASSAVATLRPNCSASFTTAWTCWTVVMRCRFAFQRLSSLPTRQCWPRMIPSGWATAFVRMPAHIVAVALSFIGILLYWVGNFDGRPILALGATRPDANAPLVLSVRQGRWHRVGVGLPDGKDVAFRVRHDRIP